ncbi:ribosomal protein L30 [Anaeramoeba ignava]|uniref:Ribosomal protein L30 n=1 Tax=Anaeramoeba ignava TaxID=1746090 RepID=A0A9Q0RBQ2_ANAIG|nr:ribosomal protein L30 [Anaeramoeba ignava]
MPPKNKKLAQEGIGNKLAVVMKSGKYFFGQNQCLKSLRKKTAKLVVISNNCPPLRRSEIEYYSLLSGSSVLKFKGSNVDLGRSCGRYFRASVVTIIDPGDSDILDLTKTN